jgi:hypothetical protein
VVFADVSELLENNGWQEKDLVHSNSRLTHIEMFLMSFSSVSCLRLFSNITTLKMIGHELDSVEDLSFCAHLKHLWLVEGKLASLKGIESMTTLTHLYLYSNQLTDLQAFAHLTRLQVLWVSDNRFTSLQGLRNLTHLQELHIAGNAISQIGSHLDAVTSLVALNLSCSAIWSFRESENLARLPKLRELHFNDPNWGPSPISSLANYQTILLCQLPNLCLLDYQEVQDDDATHARETFFKKRMFYDMKARQLRKQVQTVQEISRSGLARKFEPCHEATRTIALQTALLQQHSTDDAAKKVAALQDVEKRISAHVKHLTVRRVSSALVIVKFPRRVAESKAI